MKSDKSDIKQVFAVVSFNAFCLATKRRLYEI